MIEKTLRELLRKSDNPTCDTLRIHVKYDKTDKGFYPYVVTVIEFWKDGELIATEWHGFIYKYCLAPRPATNAIVENNGVEWDKIQAWHDVKDEADLQALHTIDSKVCETVMGQVIGLKTFKKKHYFGHALVCNHCESRDITRSGKWGRLTCRSCNRLFIS